MTINNAKKILLAVICAMLFFSVSAFATDEPVIAIVLSRSMAPYLEAVEGFKFGMNDNNGRVQYKEFDLSLSGGKHGKIAEQISSDRPDLVFVVGTEAAIFADKHLRQIPGVFSMVLNPIESGVVSSISSPGNNLTGVALDISIEKQFELIKQIAPHVETIGLVYGKNDRGWLAEKVERAAKNTGLDLVADPVVSENEVLDAIEEVCRRSDFLWAAADPMVYNKHSAKHILLLTLKKKEPFMAFSSHYVRAGALLALECDYYDIGEQASEIAVKILKGASAGNLVVEYPRKTKLIINLRTARTIGIAIPNKVLFSADEVIGK